MKRFSLLVLALGAAVAANATVFSFAGSGAQIPTLGAAPTISFNVAGLDGPIIDVDLKVNGVSHTFPDDLGALLVNNVGTWVVLFNGPGGGTDIERLNWHFDDSAAAPLPLVDPLVSGTFQGGVQYLNDTFTVPGINIGGTPNTVLNNLSNGGAGTWNLYVQDFISGDGGSIESTELILTTVPEPGTMIALGAGALALLRRRKKA